MDKKEYNKEYYNKNKNKWKPDLGKKRINDLKYQQKNKEKIKEARRKWRVENYEKEIFMSVRSRCKRTNIPFNLDLEDIQMPKTCPYLLVPITKEHSKGRVWTNPSLDRIDPTKGYVKGNVQVISMLANAMKQHATEEQLLTFAKRVLVVHSKEDTLGAS